MSFLLLKSFQAFSQNIFNKKMAGFVFAHKSEEFCEWEIDLSISWPRQENWLKNNWKKINIFFQFTQFIGKANEEQDQLITGQSSYYLRVSECKTVLSRSFVRHLIKICPIWWLSIKIRLMVGNDPKSTRIEHHSTICWIIEQRRTCKTKHK